MPRRLRSVLLVAAFVALAAAAGVASLHVTGPVEGDVGPGRVALDARADADPRTELLLPPLGSIAAETHRAPLTLSARVEQVDLAEVEDVIGSPSIEEQLRADIERDLEPLVRRLFIRSLLVAAAAGALVGAVVPRRGWRTVLVGGTAGMLGAAVVAWAAWTNFDDRAFDEPRFEGPLAEAPRVLETVRKYVDEAGAVTSRIEVLSAQISDLYAASLTDAISAGPGRQRILHVSDIHLNPVGVEVVRQLAAQFDVDAVLDTGDVTSFGHPLEGEFGSLLDGVGVPYYVVPGNHDSPEVRTTLGQFENVFIVDSDTIEIAGIEVLGVAHPVFTADNQTPRDEVDAAVARQARTVAAQVRRDGPDVLAVHDPAQAADAIGEVPLVLAGHLHERTWTDDDGTLVLTVGSTGATGLGSFTVDTDLAFEASVLYFEDGRLVAVDAVALQGTEGDFTIDRRLIHDEDGADDQDD